LASRELLLNKTTTTMKEMGILDVPTKWRSSNTVPHFPSILTIVDVLV
jgi:hypothetical protein